MSGIDSFLLGMVLGTFPGFSWWLWRAHVQRTALAYLRDQVAVRDADRIRLYTRIQALEYQLFAALNRDWDEAVWSAATPPRATESNATRRSYS